MKRQDNQERARQFLPFSALPTEDETAKPYKPRPKKMPKRRGPLPKEEVKR